MNIDKEIIELKTQNVNYPVNYRKLVQRITPRVYKVRMLHIKFKKYIY